MLKDFKAFVMKGNVIDLAVAVVIGVAFGAVITSIVDHLITPVLGLFGDQDFSQYGITLKEGEGDNPDIVLGWGAILTAVINFLAVAAAIFFLVVKPVLAIEARRKRGLEPEEETVPEDIALLTEIRDLLRARQ
jgi:large conductance mechanosensitive channel